MQSWWQSGFAALQLLIMLVVGWFAVFLVTSLLEQRMRRNERGRKGGMLATLGWVWAYSNVIGIPTLLLGAAYLLWSMSSGAGLNSGPTMLVILLMSAAAFLIGFGPGLRR